MSGKAAVVIGGGKVACRKAAALLAVGAEVLIVAPDLIDEIMVLEQTGRLEIRCGHYEASDLDGAFLAVAATDNADVNLRVAVDATSREKLVCVADAPEVGNCTFPAVLRREKLEIGISTAGGCPALAVELRDLIATLITDEYGGVVNRLAQEREKLLTEGNTGTYNTQVLRSLARQLISELNERKDTLK
jgi:siroheme synthase-like protein